jgi:hypothetical protein
MSLSFAEPCRSEADRAARVQGQDQGGRPRQPCVAIADGGAAGPSRHAAVTQLVQSVP